MEEQPGERGHEGETAATEGRPAGASPPESRAPARMRRICTCRERAGRKMLEARAQGKAEGTAEDIQPALERENEEGCRKGSCYLLCTSLREAQPPDPTAPPQNHSTPHCGWLWALALPPRSSPGEGR